MELDKLIKLFSERAKNFTSFPPSSDSKIDFANAMLKNISVINIPLEYKKFLLITNGILASSLEFYGTDNIRRANPEYIFPNILEANKNLNVAENVFLKNSIVLGCFLTYLIIFDEQDGKYNIIDNFSFAIIKSYNGFTDLLIDITSMV